MNTANGRRRRSASRRSASRSSTPYSGRGRSQSGCGRRQTRSARRTARGRPRLPVLARDAAAARHRVGRQDRHRQLDEAGLPGAGYPERVGGMAAEVGPSSPPRPAGVAGPRDVRRHRRVDDVAELGQQARARGVEAEAPGAERRGRRAEGLPDLASVSARSLAASSGSSRWHGIRVRARRSGRGRARRRTAASSRDAGGRRPRPLRGRPAAPGTPRRARRRRSRW